MQKSAILDASKIVTSFLGSDLDVGNRVLSLLGAEPVQLKLSKENTNNNNNSNNKNNINLLESSTRLPYLLLDRFLYWTSAGPKLSAIMSVSYRRVVFYITL